MKPGIAIFLLPLALCRLLEAEEPITFNHDIRPILNRNCVLCHGGIKQGGGISLIYREKALGEGKSGKPAIVPGKPEESELIRRIESDDDDEIMPKPKKGEHGVSLPPSDIDKLKTWIRQGAQWQDHWSFTPPAEPGEPELKRQDWARTKADRLILAKMESEGMQPSAEATPVEWLRRVSLDLTGLPPAEDELAAFQQTFAADKEAAMAEVVDRLLASSQFGERWAAMWLDLARYSDSMGFEKDPNRDAWPYRDWVIRAFNSDLPFDRFTRSQLAGDLLPDPAPDDLVATAFQRNTMTNTEGGTDDEEFRAAAVIDRINTTWTAWEGTTFSCVQCHGHPYDPIPHDDFYRFMAFYDNTEDADLDDDFPRTKASRDPGRQPDATRLEREIRTDRERLNTEALAVAMEMQDWSPLKASSVTVSAATGKLEQQADGTFMVSGTNPTNSVYTIQTPALPLGALRIDILPQSDDPKQWSELGSVITKLEIDQVRPDGTRETVKLKEVVSDFLAGPYEPNAVVQDGGGGGFGEYPTLWRPRYAFFVPESKVTPVEGALYEIRIHHGFSCNGSNQSCLTRKFRLSATGDERLSAWVMNPERAEDWQQHGLLRSQYDAIPGTMVPSIRERSPNARRDTRVFDRGNRTTKAQSVTAGLPLTVHPPVRNENLTRLDLAEWLTGETNPLTARVLANRLWAELFGIGIVETLEDFGSSGLPPSNQPLLDHLALRLSKDDGWHIKPFLRELVLSSAYRQSAKATPALLEKDPRNRFVAHGPRQRLTAEMVRDQALLASGLLSKKQFGPPVYPPQPNGIWKTVYNGAQWTTSTGEDRYRRAIYTYSRRTSGYPAMLTFDAPARDVCTARRIPTNTPLQALVILNDPAFIEFAQAFAKRMTSASEDLNAQLAFGYRTLTGAEPSTDIIAELAALHHDVQSEYEQNPAESAKLAATSREAALVLVASTLFNLDSAMTR